MTYEEQVQRERDAQALRAACQDFVLAQIENERKNKR